MGLLPSAIVVQVCIGWCAEFLPFLCLEGNIYLPTREKTIILQLLSPVAQEWPAKAILLHCSFPQTGTKLLAVKVLVL